MPATFIPVESRVENGGIRVESRFKGATGRTGRFFCEIAGAVFVGAGVPVFWIWLGSVIQGSRGAQAVESGTAVVMIIGLVMSYILVLMVAGAIQQSGPSAERRPPTRYPWMRSMRDEPYRPGTAKLSPVEATFVGTAFVASIAMVVWFFAFAGSPLPA